MPYCPPVYEINRRRDLATYLYRHTHVRYIRKRGRPFAVSVNPNQLDEIGLPYLHQLIGFCTKKQLSFRPAKHGEDKRPAACTVSPPQPTVYITLNKPWIKKLNLKDEDIVIIRRQNGRLVLIPTWNLQNNPHPLKEKGE